MTTKPWHGSHWPESVPHEIRGYEKPLFTVLDDAARDYPNAVYTLFNDAGRTYAEVKDSADRLADFLASRDIRQGDRVAVFLPNLPHYPEIIFGILKAGAIAVTCNPLYKVEELHYQLDDSGARAIFLMDHPGFYPIALEAVQQTDMETVIICSVKSHLPKIKGFMGSLLGKIPKAKRHEPGHLLYDQVIRNARPQPPQVRIDPVRDPALLIYTGGTTGTPKGAMQTHANLVCDLMCLEEWTRFSSEPGAPFTKAQKGGAHTFLGVLPWYHSFGMTVCLLMSAFTASRMVCVPDPKAGKPPFTELLKTIEKQKVTIVVGVPTLFSALLNHPHIDAYDLSSIACCASAAAPLPVEVLRQFEKKTGAVIFEGYGLTETAPAIAANPTNIEHRKIGTVGMMLPNADVKILDIEEGIRELPRGEDGEIALAGPQVMPGYWNKPEANAEVFREIDGKRYFLTGDIGHLDEDGFLVITDRKKDMIIVGGFNVFPRDVEEVLFSHPKVAQAAVIGVPDPHSGEAVKAFIQLKPDTRATEQEILDYCKSRMTGYKRPRQIEFRDSLPTSLVGKVLRRRLREEELKK